MMCGLFTTLVCHDGHVHVYFYVLWSSPYLVCCRSQNETVLKNKLSNSVKTIPSHIVKFLCITLR